MGVKGAKCEACAFKNQTLFFTAECTAAAASFELATQSLLTFLVNSTLGSLFFTSGFTGSEAVWGGTAFGADAVEAGGGVEDVGGGVGAGGGGRSSKSEDLPVRSSRATATATAPTTVTAANAFWLDVIFDSVDIASVGALLGLELSKGKFLRRL